MSRLTDLVSRRIEGADVVHEPKSDLTLGGAVAESLPRLGTETDVMRPVLREMSVHRDQYGLLGSEERCERGLTLSFCCTTTPAA